MEKVRPWCGQPSDLGRPKNRTLIMPCHCCVMAMHEKTCGFLDLSTGLMLLFNSYEKCGYLHHFNCQILLFLVDLQLIYTLLQTDNHASTPPLSFLQAGCPSCRLTDSVKALKAHTHSNSPGGNTNVPGGCQRDMR